MYFIDLGREAFEETFCSQEGAVGRIADFQVEEIVHFVEHPPLFTFGRGHKGPIPDTIVDWRGVPRPVHATNRGGEVTYHGPGQLVCYPHLDLRFRGRDLHRYLRDLEEVIIQTVASLGVKAFRRTELTGVWTRDGKLASIGVGVRRWVTLHGFALNVATDLRYFELIDPCGILECPMTSLDREGVEVEISDVKERVKESFGRVFAERKV